MSAQATLQAAPAVAPSPASFAQAPAPAPSPATPLFRPEVMQARQGQWLGGIRIARPPSFSLVTGLSLVMALALIAYAVWGEVARTVTVPGLLLPAGGLIQVAAPQSGVVAQLLVAEGDVVRSGQALVRLKAERITSAGDAALLNAQALAARRSSLEAERRLVQHNLQQRQEALSARALSLRAEERQVQAELETHALRLELSRKSLERQQQLASSGFVAVAQVQARQEELLDLQLRERNAQRNLQALRRDLQAVRADREALQTQSQTAMAQLERSLASLDQETAEADSRQGLTVTAPQAGRISALALSLGHAVQAGQTLLSLVPAAAPSASSGDEFSPADFSPQPLQAQLFAPSRTAGFVRPGQEVWLRYAAFPFQKFGMARGEVLNISRSPIAPQDLPSGQAQALLSAAQANEPLYRITVRLPSQTVMTYGQATALSAGMSLEADVRQESRKVWEWLLEPLLAVVGARREPRTDHD